MKKLYYVLLVLVGVQTASAQTKHFFKVRVENVSQHYKFSQSGVFNTPDGAENPAPVFPGDSYSFSFSALEGSYLSFATMFVQSNDLFYAPDEMGIALYDDMNMPVSGDVTDQLYLWDAGTEENQEPGLGMDQPPHQSGPNTGATDTDNTVRMVNDMYTYPDNMDVIMVTINSDNAPMFTVTIKNVSTDMTISASDGSHHAAPLAPGVWVVHTESAPLFTEGMMNNGMGLEQLAEDGDPGPLYAYLDSMTGLFAPLAPGIWALHSKDGPFFTDNGMERGYGLEALAEDGDPSVLHTSLADMMTVDYAGVFNTPVGAEGPAPIGPGGVYEFIFSAEMGQKLSLATMFVQSNDLFYAPDGMGIELFTTDNMPVSGDITSHFSLWDAGTEENEEPGIGANQPPRQSGPNTGSADMDNTVRMVNDGYMYPDLMDVLKVTIEPLESSMFYVKINNVSTDSTLMPSDDSKQPVPLAPGVWAVHNKTAPLFTPDMMERGKGLEQLAEDGNASVLADALHFQDGVINHGIFNTPAGETGPGPLLPEHAYEFIVQAVKGSYLSFATMFVPSNDLFYAPDEMGIALFDMEGNPMASNATGKTKLWDAGTEANEEPGAGPNQPQRQSGPDTGDADMDQSVRMVDDGYTYPSVESVIHVTITPAMLEPVTVLIENVSTTETLKPSDGSSQPVPLAPGIWTVHEKSAPIFHDEMTDMGYGLEDLAEDGNPVHVAHALKLQDSAVTSGVFNTPVGAAGPAPIGPGDAYEFKVWAWPGSMLSFATMFVPSNDLFYAPDTDGIPLFNENGSPISGDVTDMIYLWDAGTEENEEPGTGPNQPQRQAGADTGPVDMDNRVRMVNDGYTYPDVSSVLRVTLNSTTTSVEREEDSTVPTDFVLEQNYPNPFNPQTTIKYSLPQNSHVELSIFNIKGQKIAELVNVYQAQGSYAAIWDGHDDSGNPVSSGVYIYQLQANGQRSVKQMVFIK